MSDTENKFNIEALSITKYREAYRDDSGCLHRLDGPASTIYDNDVLLCEEYIINGIMHREDGPAYISYHPNGQVRLEEYIMNDTPYFKNGINFIEYYPDGIVKCISLSEDDGDTSKEITYYESGKISHTIYYTSNEIHDEYGPALIEYNEDGTIISQEYYIYNTLISADKAEWCLENIGKIINDFDEIPNHIHDDIKIEFKLKFH